MCDTHEIIDYRIFLKTGNAGNIIYEKYLIDLITN